MWDVVFNIVYTAIVGFAVFTDIEWVKFVFIILFFVLSCVGTALNQHNRS